MRMIHQVPMSACNAIRPAPFIQNLQVTYKNIDIDFSL